MLYNPEQLEQAAVRDAGVLWFKPIDTLAQVVGLVATACALALNINTVLAIGLGLVCTVILWLLVRIIIVILLILSMKYKPFHNIGMHLFAGFKSQSKRKRTE